MKIQAGRDELPLHQLCLAYCPHRLRTVQEEAEPGLDLPRAVMEPGASSWISCPGLSQSGTTFHIQTAVGGEGVRG